MSNHTAAAVSFRSVTKEFPPSKRSRSASADPVRAVDGVDLDIQPGRITGVIGYSGAGKSTLVRLINALERPTSGQVLVDGEDITGLGENGLRQLRAGVGMIFQQFNLFASRTVAGNVAYPLKLAGIPKQERQSRVAELLRFVGIADKAGSYPSQLSGGQKQRVGIARALANSPKILLADEATSALDPETTGEVLALLRRVNRDLGTTIVVITHEMDVVRSLCHDVAVMEQGKVVEQGEVYEVFARPRTDAAKSFVRTALKDRPGPDTVRRLRQHHRGRIATVTICEEMDSRASVFDLLRRSSVRGTVIYGGISEVAERPFGSLTYELDGTDAEIDRLLTDLAELTSVEEWPHCAEGEGGTAEAAAASAVTGPFGPGPASNPVSSSVPSKEDQR